MRRTYHIIEIHKGLWSYLAFVMSEGAWVLVMKSLEHAMKRGAPIVVVYLGGAVDCNAHLMVDPRSDGLGVSLCIESILEGVDVTHPILAKEVVLNVNSSSHGELAFPNGSSIAAGSEG